MVSENERTKWYGGVDASDNFVAADDDDRNEIERKSCLQLTTQHNTLLFSRSLFAHRSDQSDAIGSDRR
ncbi:unnamed protein product [Anisakis simplex]|uniref:Uncharacterized protein n=1 Tax=Anisakis simplex TaxID=6269 RepID=A0A0M3KGI5_ANISI|nr:unnamed protein product [Anisakis simplex]